MLAVINTGSPTILKVLTIAEYFHTSILRGQMRMTQCCQIHQGPSVWHFWLRLASSLRLVFQHWSQQAAHRCLSVGQHLPNLLPGAWKIQVSWERTTISDRHTSPKTATSGMHQGLTDDQLSMWYYRNWTIRRTLIRILRSKSKQSRRPCASECILRDDDLDTRAARLAIKTTSPTNPISSERAVTLQRGSQSPKGLCRGLVARLSASQGSYDGRP